MWLERNEFRIVGVAGVSTAVIVIVFVIIFFCFCFGILAKFHTLYSIPDASVHGPAAPYIYFMAKKVPNFE